MECIFFHGVNLFKFGIYVNLIHKKHSLLYQKSLHEKIFVFLTLLCTQLFAETWKKSGIFYAWREDRVYFSDSMEGTLKKIYDEDFFEGISLYIRYYGHHGSSRYSPNISIEWTGNDILDSIWISKYWMDDSLKNTPVAVKENLDLSDFRLLNLDSLQLFDTLHFYKSYSIIDGIDSSQFYFVYKKETYITPIAYWQQEIHGNPVILLYLASFKMMEL